MRKNRHIENSVNSDAWPRAAAAALVILAALFLAPAGRRQQAWAQQGQPAGSSKQALQASKAALSDELMLRIVRAEDERRWDNDLGPLLFNTDARVRRRAALAAGRIGDERSVSALLSLLQTDRDAGVRAMAAFALGETESAVGADGLTASALKAGESSRVRARAVEALGKIAAALPKAQEARALSLGQVILKVLEEEGRRSPKPDREVVLLGLTAVLRARPAAASTALARFLSAPDARVRADALNTLARLRVKDANEQTRALLAGDPDAVVRANAARVLGVAEDASSLDTLADRVLKDTDERVRVSAIRALGSLKDARAAPTLLARANTLYASFHLSKMNSSMARPHELNELLEVASALGRILVGTNDERAVAVLRLLREKETGAPEVETAFARIAPALYLRETPFGRLGDEALRAAMMKDWRRVSSLAQGLAEIGGIKAETAGSGAVSLQADAQIILRSWLDDQRLPPLAAPDVLRSLAVFKANDLGQVLRRQLSAGDVIVRSAAADLLGELPADADNTRALGAALPVALRDELNDAALSILDSLAKQKSAAANEALKTALDSTDPLVRRRAVALLKANDAGDFSARLASITTRNTAADYQRALARVDRVVRAVVSTDKGAFTIELLPQDAPLTVDNFVQLAQRRYFDGVTFHRVVPNFVVQGGDPRGDGNGGPGYQIRCEINEVPYERGAVGMALSGKDTGGSQWFVTHSPQPHLDGGYTVFGRITNGMEVIDKIVRGDVIRSITVTESAPPASKPEKAAAKAEKAPAKAEKAPAPQAKKKRTEKH